VVAAGITLTALPAAADGIFQGVWSDLTPFGSAGSRRDPGVAYDSQGDRLVVIGGAGGGNWTSLLSFSGRPAWTSAAEASPPNVSEEDRAFYDPIHNRFVLVTNLMQVWELDLENPVAWSQLTLNPSPPPRGFCAATYDALRNRAIIFGGGPSTGLYNDMWALSLSGTPQWTQITGAGQAPPPRWGSVAAYDSASDRVIVTSGSLDTGYSVSNDVWALSLSGTPTWTQLHPGGPTPPARMLAGAVCNGFGEFLLYGGYPGSGGQGALGDVWELSLRDPVTWIALSPAGTAPPPRWSFGAVYRSAGGQMVIYGGFGGGSGNDTWTLDFGSVHPPTVREFSPTAGRIGDQVVILGTWLTGASDVQFNGTHAPILAASFDSISTRVPAGATTGPITVTTPYGSSRNAGNFFVGEKPEIDSFSPSGGKVGTIVTIKGKHFTGATGVRFGLAAYGYGWTDFVVDSDEQITAVACCTRGPISVTNPVGTAVSTLDFDLISGVTVRADGSGDAPTVQAGIDSIRARQIYLDVLWIEPGDYAEDVVIPAGARTYYITCRGGPAKTRIRSLTIRSVTGGRSIEITGLSVADSTVEEVGSTPVRFTDCRFTGAVRCRSSSRFPATEFERCRFEAPVALHTDGTVDECLFLGGRADFRTHEDGYNVFRSVFVGQDTAATIQGEVIVCGCTFVNANLGIGGITSYKQSITQCLFVNLRGPAVNIPTDPRYYAPPALVHHNDVWMGNGDPYQGNVNVSDNLTIDPQFCDVVASDFHVAASSPCAPSSPYGQIGALGVGCSVMTVPVDVQSHQINLRSNAPVEAAILGHRLFDPHRVDPSTVRLAGAAPSPRGSGGTFTKLEDVNGDGIADLLLAFDSRDLRPDGAVAILEGRTVDGASFRGSDSVEVAGTSLRASLEAATDFPTHLALAVPPTHGYMTLLLALASREKSTVEVFDITGRRVVSRDVSALGPGHHRVQLQERLASGLYLLRARQGTEAVVVRAIVLR
jgi:hypothetical protein